MTRSTWSARKAVAAGETLITPFGLVAVAYGVLVWVCCFRLAVPRLGPERETLTPVLWAILATGILGTLLNDAGVSVWLSVALLATFTAGWFWARPSQPMFT